MFFLETRARCVDQANLASAFQVQGLRVFATVPLLFILLLETGSYYVTQASLEFLGLSNCLSSWDWRHVPLSLLEFKI